MNRLIAVFLLFSVILTGCGSQMKEPQNNLEKIVFSKNEVIQDIEKRIDQKFTKVSEHELPCDYVIEDFELVEGYYGQLQVLLRDDVLGTITWYLNGRNLERCEALIKILDDTYEHAKRTDSSGTAIYYNVNGFSIWVLHRADNMVSLWIDGSKYDKQDYVERGYND